MLPRLKPTEASSQGVLEVPHDLRDTVVHLSGACRWDSQIQNEKYRVPRETQTPSPNRHQTAWVRNQAPGHSSLEIIFRPQQPISATCRLADT